MSVLGVQHVIQDLLDGDILIAKVLGLKAADEHFVGSAHKQLFECFVVGIVYCLNRSVASRNVTRRSLIWLPVAAAGMVGAGLDLRGGAKGTAEKVA